MKLTAELLNPTNVIVQGITGSQGSYHAKLMRAAGTNIIAGTSPGKAGTAVDDIPVYESVKAIQAVSKVDASVIFVPAQYAKAAIFEAVDAAVPLIVCITEGIPVHDMIAVRQYMEGKSSVLIGPNCPGFALPGKKILGIIPKDVASLGGSVAIVSRSGTLTYEIANMLSIRGMGQKYVIGIGGDPIKGVDLVDCLELFESDPEVMKIVIIGEIGGRSELDAADYVLKKVTKPVFAYVAGHTAPVGVQMGHAGAILGSSEESAANKTEIFRTSGATVADSVVELSHLIK